jgi:ribosomal protein S18 acetylase RimI-like enzyme
MTRDDLAGDLWLRAQVRGRNIGSHFPSMLESEIAQRGYQPARLRVVAENTAAQAFDRARGWQETGDFTHEQLGFLMINLYSPLHPDDFNANPIT